MNLVKYLATALAVLGLSACSTTQPEANSTDFISASQAEQFSQQAQRQFNLQPAEVKAALQQAEYQAKIISIMNRPFEAQAWAVYKAHMLTPNRISQGKAFSQQYRQPLQQAQDRYGVPANIVVAILGVETFYGKNQGNYRVLDALATLSFAYPKRAAFFQKELANYLVLCQQNHWPVRQLKGSYAGAFGMGQFMPSSYRAYAVSATGQSPDISNNPQDAIFSVAHYFAAHGWQSGQPIAVAVSVPASMSAMPLPKLTKPKHTLRYWQAAGVTIPARYQDLDSKAELVVETDTMGRREAWLIFHNFYVISRYNPSLNYTLAVYGLSQALGSGRF